MFFNTRDLKKMAMWPVKAAVNRVDFVKIVRAVSEQEPGRTIIQTEPPIPAAFPDQEQIIQRTIELAMADLAGREEAVSAKAVEEYARSISCRYDYDLHQAARLGILNVLAHVFEHYDIRQLFVSEDRRELKHIPRLMEARRNGLGVVYLCNHSSHWDEFIVDLVLSQLGIALPLFAAGSNMMATPTLEQILMVGSYLIIRKGATKTYLATLFNYCRALCEMGKQQGIFLEAWAGGARTRDGSLRYPRRLVTLQGAMASQRDVLIQPVVISYGAVPEDLGLSERAGALSWVNGMAWWEGWLKNPFSPKRAVAQALSGLYGRAYISFCQPKLLSELDDMWSKGQAELSRDEFVSLYCMREIARDKKIMASQLAARGVVRARHDGSDLIEATQAELDDLIQFHRRTFQQEPDLEDFIIKNKIEDVVTDGLRTLRRRKVLGGRSGSDGLPKILKENGLQYYATHGDRRLYSPSAKENIVVIGAGPWGYGLACLVGQRLLEDKKYLNSSLMLFDSREDLVTSLIETRTHPKDFTQTHLPKNVFPVSDATAAFRKATEVIISTPVELFESDVRCVLDQGRQPLTLIMATRGFEQTTHRLPMEIARQILKESGRNDVNLLVISGPVTPLKLAEGVGGSLVLAGPAGVTKTVSGLFSMAPFNVFQCEDPIGVQVAAVMAEVYSLLGAYLIRTKEMKGRGQVATYIRETSEEAMTLAVALGGRRETFLPDNPAWVAEYVAAGLGGPGATFGREAGKSLSKARAAVMDAGEGFSRDADEKGPLMIGYTGIRSAYMVAKDLDLNVPRLRQAYRIFWKD